MSEEIKINNKKKFASFVKKQPKPELMFMIFERRRDLLKLRGQMHLESDLKNTSIFKKKRREIATLFTELNSQNRLSKLSKYSTKKEHNIK